MNFIYDQYIQYLKNRQVNAGEKLYKHRILPGHKDGRYIPQNIVFVTYSEHCLAHFYRFLTYQDPNDELAYRLMVSQDPDVHLLKSSCGGKIGGKKTAVIHKNAKTLFYSEEWQKKYGFKKAGQRNVESGYLKKLNASLTKEQRSKAGKRGGRKVTDKHKLNKTGMFNPKAIIQKRGNLKRWGIVIDGQRIKYDRLSSDFIEYHIHYGTQKSYINPKNENKAISSQAENTFSEGSETTGGV